MATLRRERRFRTTVAALITVPFVIPFLMLISTAVRRPDDFIESPGGLPSSFTFDNIVEAWNDADLAGGLQSSLFVCFVACVVSGLTSLTGAFWFRTHQGRFVGLMRWVLVAGYAIPTVAWLIPVFVILAQGQLTDSLLVLGIVNGVASLPFSFYLVHTFFNQVLRTELLEAATLDGAGMFGTFWRIAVPLSYPALASTTALVFVWTFGDLLIAATLLQDASVQTITLAAASLSTREAINIQGQAAAALVALIPMVLVFAGAQKALSKGFGAGSGK